MHYGCKQVSSCPIHKTRNGRNGVCLASQGHKPPRASRVARLTQPTKSMGVSKPEGLPMGRAAVQPGSVLKIWFPGSFLQGPGPGKPLQPKTSQPILRALSSCPNDFPGPVLASALRAVVWSCPIAPPCWQEAEYLPTGTWARSQWARSRWARWWGCRPVMIPLLAPCSLLPLLLSFQDLFSEVEALCFYGALPPYSQ